MKNARWFCMALIAIAPAPVRSDEGPTADELLSAYEKSVEKLARVRIEQKQQGPPRGAFDTEWTILRDGHRWKIDKKLVPNGNRPAANQTREQTLIGDEIVSLTLRYDAGNDQPVIGGLTANLERVAARSWRRVGIAGVLFGRVPGDAGHPLWTILRESGSLERLEKTEVIDGVETYVLRCRGKYGEHKLWLDPASGGLPRRIEVEKIAGNLLDEQQLGTAPAPNAEAQSKPATPRAVVRPPAPIEYSTVIDKIQIEKKSGLFVITGFEERGSITLVAGKRGNRNKTEAKFEVVDVNPPEFPEDSFRFEVDVPNGTLVSVVDDYPPGYQGPVKAEHEWADGKIRPRAGK